MYRCRFRVRGYEVGPTGAVHDSAIVNYMQQAAFEASAHAGYDTRRYDALGTIWVIRKQTVAYLAPLTFGDVVEVETWVSSTRRVHCYREYALRRAADARLVALAQADWIYVDTASLFPCRIPQIAIDLFEPNGVKALDEAPPLEPARERKGRPFVYCHRTRRYELDNLRHVNNAKYVDWLNQARLDALEEMGFPLADQATLLETLGLIPAPVRYTVEYFAPAGVHDEVEVHSGIVIAGATQLTWTQEITRGEDHLLAAQATVCFQDEAGRVMPLPPALLKAS
jgi:YbgC/YbaW family acyl-CoA thioester hydrolase